MNRTAHLRKMASSAVKPRTHTTCRSIDSSNLVSYQVSSNEKSVKRPIVPENMVSWNVDFPGYEPIKYTSPIVLDGPSWADPNVPK